MAEAYKVLQDVSLPRAVRELYDNSQNRGGKVFYQTEGRTYSKGDYVLAEDITPPLREKIENGELDHLVEPVDADEARDELDKLRRSQHVSQFVAEHAVEAHAMELAGHEVVEQETGEVLLSEVPNDKSTEQVVAGADEVPVEDLTEVRSQTESELGEEKAEEKSEPKKKTSSRKKEASKE